MRLTHISKCETFIEVWKWKRNIHALGQIISSWKKLVAIAFLKGIANEFFICNSFVTFKDCTPDQEHVKTCESTLEASAAITTVHSVSSRLFHFIQGGETL